jgi:hypothetical protein
MTKSWQFDQILVRLPFFMLFTYSIYIDIGMSVGKCTELCLDVLYVEGVWYVCGYVL